jgi:hypothetical protein
VTRAFLGENGNALNWKSKICAHHNMVIFRFIWLIYETKEVGRMSRFQNERIAPRAQQKIAMRMKAKSLSLENASSPRLGVRREEVAGMIAHERSAP